MNKGSYIFNQMVSYLPARKFDRLVTKYKGNYKIRHFSCWNQLSCMIFGHLKGCESLGDIIRFLNEDETNTYHLGLGRNISKANFAKANENRDFRIFSDYAIEFAEAVSQRTGDKYDFIREQIYNIYSLAFQWNLLREKDVKPANSNQINIQDFIPLIKVIPEKPGTEDFLFQPGILYIFNSGDPVNYSVLYRMHLSKSFFIIPFSDPAIIIKQKSSFTEEKEPAETDYFNHFLDYPEATRLIKYPGEQKLHFYQTNHPDLPIETIADIYKKRFEIEALSSYIKQSLRSRTFWGTSSNAVRIQIFTGIITSLLLNLVRSVFHIRGSTVEFRNQIRESLLIKAPIKDQFPMAESPPGRNFHLTKENPSPPQDIPSSEK